MNVTIGCDPEVFLQDITGAIVSAVGHVGGTKENPLRVKCGAVQEDNVMAEFNTDPARSAREFVTNIRTVLEELRSRVSLSAYDLAIISSHEFTIDQLQRSGRQALMFGCDPDFDAYTGEQNTAPSPYTTLRTAGGHIHVGYDDGLSTEKNCEIVRRMDLLLGVPSVLLDDDQRRRTMYGKAGAMRNKEYGVEYRSLSNFWIKHTDYIEWAYNQSVQAATSDIEVPSAATIHCINTGDRDLAKKLIKEHGITMP